MACEYCKEARAHYPMLDTSRKRPALHIVGKEMAFYPYRDDGKTLEHIHYAANYCWNCGEELRDNADTYEVKQ